MKPKRAARPRDPELDRLRILALAKSERTLKGYLRDLVTICEQAIAALDAEMKTPSDVNRGKRVAAICNALELQKDQAKHFGLGVPFPKREPLACGCGPSRGQCGNAFVPDPCYCACHERTS